MLTDYWLLSDLDGTFISTPHKAQGQYLPLTRSPCYEPIKRWLLNGGNVCVITTADQRVIDQVYQPLRQCLAESEARCAEYLARRKRQRSNAAGNSVGGHDSDTRSHRKQPMSGKLLLSLYTGAVLYLCTSKSVYLLPGYANAMHCATREAVALTKTFQVSLLMAPLVKADVSASCKEEMVACVKGTCINRATSDRLQGRVKELYMAYLKDILHGEPVVLEALKAMSARYKRMWRAILTFLENMFLFHKGQNWAVKLPPTGKDFTILYSGAAQSPESTMWKMEFFNRCDGILSALGILRVEYVEAEVFFDDGGNSCTAGVDATGTTCPAAPRSASQRTTEAAERRRRAENADRKFVVRHAVDVMLRSAPTKRTAEVRPVVENFANYMTNLLGTDPRDLKKRTSNAPATHDDVAQVILLGLPFTLFSRYFKKSIPDFIKGGVQAVPQPNSVVFSKTGVSKSTTLRYLLGKERVVDVLGAEAGTTLTAAVPAGGAAHDLGRAFAACVETSRAISLGDNPHTTDYELTVFRDVAFVSVEREAQRTERHHRIQRRLARAKAIEERGGRPTLPDGSPAPTYAELVEAQQSSGPMMNDQLLPNIVYVGGEEDGTAALLAALMDRLKVPPLRASEGYVATEDRGVPVADFQRTLAAAASSARRNVQASRVSKL